MEPSSPSSRRRRRPAIIQRVTSILSKRLSKPANNTSSQKRPSVESLTPVDQPGTPTRFVHHRKRSEASDHYELSSPISTSPMTASPTSVAARAPDRLPDATPPSRCAHLADRKPQHRRFSARFSTRSFSRLDLVPKRRREDNRSKSLMGCECEAAHERDVLSTRLGELAMTEMENQNLRAQVDDLQRAVESVRQQAQDEVDSLVLEMQVMRKRHRWEQGDYFEYSDDEEDTSVYEHRSMVNLNLGERALDAAEVAAMLQWDDDE